MKKIKVFLIEFRNDNVYKNYNPTKIHNNLIKNNFYLAKILKLSKVEVYEVASFYAHFDIVKEGDTPPPKTTIRVCNSLSCQINGSTTFPLDLDILLPLESLTKACTYTSLKGVFFMK